MLFITKVITFQHITSPQFWAWAFAQNSFFQFYNTPLLRDFGTGVLNGSLWTISVELQFYFLTPLLYTGYLYFKHKNPSLYFGVLTSLFLALYLIQYFLPESENIFIKLYSVSCLPWFFMFLVGSWFAVEPKLQKLALSLSYPLLLGSLFLLASTTLQFHDAIQNKLTPLLYIVIAMLTFKTAYTKPHISSKLLKNADFSYGMYIYHMPFINFFLFLGFQYSLFSLLSALILTFFFACFSWYMVEKPLLKRKQKSLHQV